MLMTCWVKGPCVCVGVRVRGSESGVSDEGAGGEAREERKD